VLWVACWARVAGVILERWSPRQVWCRVRAADPSDVLRNPIHDLDPPLRSFVTDRVALLGDAAHAMTPNLGRGACEAISDALSIVTHLTT
jgi:2-polyprenyl-6-methoxyphenol hydroxylase-like FAD-dependent oxidoreductase